MNPTDLGLDYTGGINAPDAGAIGLPVIADESGVQIDYRHETATLARDRTGTKMVDDAAAQLYDVDALAPRVYRFQTVDATPFVFTLPSLPKHGVATYDCEVRAVQDDGAHFVDQFFRVDYRVSKIAPGSSGLIAAAVASFPAAVDTIGVGGLAYSGGNLEVTGKASTVIQWTIKVRYSVCQYGV